MSNQSPSLQLFHQTINQGQKIEYIVKVTGTKPLTVTWYRDDTVKLKSGANAKITYAKDEAKLLIMEADGEHDGVYKLEAVNAFGTETLTAKVTVISECCLNSNNIK